MVRGEKKESIHFVKISDTLRVLLEDETFNGALELSRNNERGARNFIIEDIKDGKRYKTLDFFTENPEAIVILLYSDGVEVTNPLGAGKGKHKLCNVYFQVADIPRFQRSKIDRLLLVMTFREKLLKKYTYSLILRPLLNDLVKLECEGIDVDWPVPRTVKAGLLLYSGDNLGKKTLYL